MSNTFFLVSRFPSTLIASNIFSSSLCAFKLGGVVEKENRQKREAWVVLPHSENFLNACVCETLRLLNEVKFPSLTGTMDQPKCDIQGGRSWQLFGEGKNGHKSFRQARLCYFRDKCVVFERNRKFAN